MPSATQIKKGQVVITDGNLYRILKLEHITPGKGNAIIQAELRNLKTGVKTENRYRSSENVDVAEMTTRKLKYLYEADGVYHFMDTENFEQYELSKDLLEDVADFLLPDANYEAELHDGRPIGLSLPQRLTLKVIQTDPSQKGSSGKTKPATLESGLVIRVPLFVGEGDCVVIDTETKSYVERA